MLPSDDVWDIAQDAHGYLWFATSAGLVRNDGVGTRTFNTHHFDHGRVGPAAIYSIAPDPENGVWFATDELTHLDPWSSRLTTVGISATWVAASDVGVWAGDDDNVVFFDYATRSIGASFALEPSLNNLETLATGSDGPTRATDSDGNLYMADGTVLYVAETKGHMHSYPIPGGVDGLGSRRAGGAWLSSPSGLWVVGEDRRPERIQEPGDDSAFSGLTRALLEDHAGNIWIGHDDGRVTLHHEDNPATVTVDSDAGPLWGEVAVLFEDADGGVWASYLGPGISRIWAAGSGFTGLEIESTTWGENLVPINAITYYNDELYAATQESVIERYDAATGTWVAAASHLADADIQPRITSLVANESLWIGTWGHGLYRANFENDTNYVVPLFGTTDRIRHLHLDDSNRVWASVWGFGAAAIDSTGRVVEQIGDDGRAGTIRGIEAIQVVGQTAYIGGHGGLEIIDLDSGHVVTNNAKNGVLVGTSVSALHVENDTTVWVATDAGLERVNPVTSTGVLINDDDGLPVSDITTLEPHPHRDLLWVGSTDGLSLVDSKQLRVVRTFDRSDGLQSASLSPAPGVGLNDGSVLFATRGGIIVAPSDIEDQAPTPPVIHVECVDGCGPDFDGSTLTNPGSLTLGVLAQHDAGQLLQYRLVGRDTEWTTLGGHTRQVTFAGLTPGSYRFEARIGNSGKWTPVAPPGKPGGAIEIKITTKWWNDPQVRLAAALALLGLVAIALASRSIQQRRRAEVLEATIAVRTRELDASLLEAEQANRAKDQFLSSVTHELRSPLTSILGYTDLLRAGEQTSTQDRYTDLIAAAGRHLSDMVEDLLDLNPSTSTGLRLVYQPCQLAASIQQVAELTRVAAADHGTKVSVAFDGTFADYLSTDPRRLRQILWNLLSNAVQHAQATQISVSVSARPATKPGYQAISFEVADNGGNIDGSVELFERFQRGANAESGGMGLGLAISSELTKALGGELELEVNPGTATTFTFTLIMEIVSHRLEAIDDSPVVVETISTPIVYVVDDEESMRLLLVEMFAVNGWRAQAFNSPADAEEAFEQEMPDMVITDVMMAPMSGVAFAAHLRARYGSSLTCPLIACTGVPQDAEESGEFDDVLQKPVTLSSVGELIERTAARLTAAAS